jgi:hypothetical protein
VRRRRNPRYVWLLSESENLVRKSDRVILPQRQRICPGGQRQRLALRRLGERHDHRRHGHGLHPGRRRAKVPPQSHSWRSNSPDGSDPNSTNNAARQEMQGKWTGSGQSWHQPNGAPGTCARTTSHNSNNRRTCRGYIGRGPHVPRTARRTVPRDTCTCRAIAVCVWPCCHKSRILESVCPEIIPKPPPTRAAVQPQSLIFNPQSLAQNLRQRGPPTERPPRGRTRPREIAAADTRTANRLGRRANPQPAQDPGQTGDTGQPDRRSAAAAVAGLRAGLAGQHHRPQLQ